MGTHKRTARQFQLEAMEPRWAPGGLSGGVLGDRMVSRQVQVSHVVPLGGVSGGVLGDRATAHIGEEIPQVRGAHVVPLGGVPGGVVGQYR